MSVVVSLKNELIKRISALSTVQKCYGSEKMNPEGFPAVFVTPTSMTGEFTSNAENRRIYSYRILVLYPIGQNLESVSNSRMDEAEDVISDVLDQIINDLDQHFTLNNNSLMLFVEAVDGNYGYVAYEGGYARSIEIIANIQTDVTVV